VLRGLEVTLTAGEEDDPRHRRWHGPQ
jgi:hypothetical protein